MLRERGVTRYSSVHATPPRALADWIAPGTRTQGRPPYWPGLCAFAFIAASLPSAALADLSIYHLDVGMGDSTLFVDSETRQTLLVDTGNIGMGKKGVAPALKALGISRVDYFVATHYDQDHIGGLPEIVGRPLQKAGRVLDRGPYTDRELETEGGSPTSYAKYLKAIEQLGTREIPKADCSSDFVLSSKTKVQIVAVGGSYALANCVSKTKQIAKSEDNDLSIAMVVRHGDFSYFIGGDLTGGGNGTTDMESLIAGIVGDLDVLKLSHHGSNTSSNAKFLSVTSPDVVVISVGNGGVNKRYGLPPQTTLDRLKALSPMPHVYLTHLGEGGTLPEAVIVEGAIIIHTDGVSYSVNGDLYAVDERGEP